MTTVELTAGDQGITTAPHATSPHLSDAHFPALDGLRGIAILWVMFFHMNVMTPKCIPDRLWSAFCHQGGLGVDIFFVLSGFLITGILFDTRSEIFYFRNFYARRILRIFPLYYAVVAFSLLILPHIHTAKSAKFGSVQSDAIFYWLHLSNFAIARRGKFVHGILDVSWSLAIEEQFYLLWPLIVLTLRRRALMSLCVVLVVVSAVSRVLLWRHGVSPVAIYTLTFCRMDALCMGSWLALFVRHGGGRRFGVIPLIVAIIAVGIWIAGILTGPAVLQLATTTSAIAFATACLMLVLVRGHSRILTAAFELRPLRSLGKLSYALYLFHYPLMAILRDTIYSRLQSLDKIGSALPGQLVFDACGVLIAVLAAQLSWRCYENQFLKLKRFFPKARQLPAPLH